MGVGWGINSLSAIPQDYAYIPVNVVGEKVYMELVYAAPQAQIQLQKCFCGLCFPVSILAIQYVCQGADSYV